MIIKGLLLVVYFFILALAQVFLVLPDVSLPAFLVDPIVTAGHYAISLDHFIPAHELILVIVGTFLIFESAILTWKFINWTIRKIPGIS